jgi:DNA-binding response OmpR family regulator
MNTDKTIMIVDDEEDLRDTVEYKFSSSGFNVVTAVDGVDALEKLKTINPDLIILDMNMPRMNGLDFYNKITGSEDKPPYPVLVLTARANMEQLFKDLDVDGFMPKPFDLDALYQEGAAIVKKASGLVKTGDGAAQKRARRICIAENEKAVSDKLAIAFLDAGYVVNTAQSGASLIKRVGLDVPDVVVVKLSLNDIAGDVAILKLKRLEIAQKVKFVLYSNTGADKDQVLSQIASKGDIDDFVVSYDPATLVDKVDALF